MFALPVSDILGLSVIIIFTGVIIFLMQHLLGQVIRFNQKTQSETDIRKQIRTNSRKWLSKALTSTLDPIYFVNGDRNGDLWLEKFFVDLHLSQADSVGTKIVKEVINRDEIFQRNPENGLFPTHQLLVGDAGFGKTILCYKLLYDWTANQEYMKRYDLVIFGNLRNYNGEPLDNWIMRNIENQLGNSMKELDYFKEVLLLLDGFDGISSGIQKALLSLLEGRSATSVFHTAHMLVSSRPPMERTLHALFDRTLVICGFNESQEKKFIQCFMSTNSNVSHLDELLSEPQISTIRTSPLLMHTLYSLKLHDKTDLEKIDSATALLTYVFQKLIQRVPSLNSKGKEEPTDLQCLVPLGKFTYFIYEKQSIYGGFTFTLKEAQSELSEDFVELLLSLGVFRYASTFRGERNVKLFKPVNFILAIFLIAIYFEDHVKDLIQKRQRITIPSFNEYGTPYLMQYLCGKLGPSAYHLFRYLQERKKYYMPFHDLCAYVNDCRNTEANVAEAAKLGSAKVVNMNLENYTRIIPHYLESAALIMASTCFSCEVLSFTSPAFEYHVVEKIFLLPLFKRQTPLKEVHTSLEDTCYKKLHNSLEPPTDTEIKRFLLLMKANVEILAIDCHEQTSIFSLAELNENTKFKTIIFNVHTFREDCLDEFKATISFCKSLRKNSPVLENIEIKATCRPCKNHITKLLFKRKCCYACELLNLMVDEFIEHGRAIKTERGIFTYGNKYAKVALCEVKKNASSLARYLRDLNKLSLSDKTAKFDADKADINDEELVVVAIGVILWHKKWTIHSEEVLDESDVEIDAYCPGINVKFMPYVDEKIGRSSFTSHILNKCCF